MLSCFLLTSSKRSVQTFASKSFSNILRLLGRIISELGHLTVATTSILVVDVKKEKENPFNLNQYTATCYSKNIWSFPFWVLFTRILLASLRVFFGLMCQLYVQRFVKRGLQGSNTTHFQHCATFSKESF